MNNQVFQLHKDIGIRNICILLLILPCFFIFDSMYLNDDSFKIDYFFVIIFLMPFIGLVLWYMQRNITCKTDENGLKIIKQASFILPECSTYINYSDIKRILDAGGVYKRFHIIVLKNNKEINIPSQINKDFDNFIRELNKKLSQNSDYKEYNKIKDNQNENARYIIIFLACIGMIFPLLLLWQSNIFTWSIFGIWVIALFICAIKMCK